jgi:hypothetical protein
MRGSKKVIPPTFLRKYNCNNNKVYTMIHKSSAIKKLLLTKPTSSFSTHFCQHWERQCIPMLQNFLTWLIMSNYKYFVSISCHQPNDINVPHSLQGQTSGSQRVPDLGCKQDREEQSLPFLWLPHICASWCQARHCCEWKQCLIFRLGQALWHIVTIFLKFPCITCDILQSRGRKFYNMVQSDLLNTGRNVLKLIQTLWKNSCINVWINHVNFIIITITFSEKKWMHYYHTTPHILPNRPTPRFML